MLTNIAAVFTTAKKKYDKGGNALDEALKVGTDCLVLLNKSATLRPFGNFSGPPRMEYWVAGAGGALSRPYRPDLFIEDPALFATEAQAFIRELRNGQSDHDRFDKVVYTAVSAFCLCYDVWKPKSRKTPGTFFEVLIASAARVRFPAMAT